ncbi:MAG: TetR/AcrR family transcriptional regulator [Gammaproteobacteria bacterium PRO8]|nr:TetR/AcrR family transcriptional regulator [Gammaproteobacteria bacterium PRO8]
MAMSTTKRKQMRGSKATAATGARKTGKGRGPGRGRASNPARSLVKDPVKGPIKGPIKGPVKGPVKGKGQLRREATEALLVEAFGRIVQRHGLRFVGVNEVVKEAGVGKALLYRYFGGLPGLVEAWGRENRIWPKLVDMVPLSGAPGATAAQVLKKIVVRNAQVHRDDPVRVEMLADELMTPTAISGALGEIRKQVGRDHAALFARNRDFRDHHLTMVVMMAAASYLAMRAVKAPRFMGEDLADAATWTRLMAEIEAIIERVVG